MGIRRAIIRSWVLPLALLAAVAGPGCASPQPQHVVHGTAPDGNQGSAWEAVLPRDPGSYVVAAEDVSRRDAALGVPAPDSGLWPEPYRPSLDEIRQVFLNRSADSVHYFSQYGSYGTYGSYRSAPWRSRR